MGMGFFIKWHWEMGSEPLLQDPHLGQDMRRGIRMILPNLKKRHGTEDQRKKIVPLVCVFLLMIL